MHSHGAGLVYILLLTLERFLHSGFGSKGNSRKVSWIPVMPLGLWNKETSKLDDNPDFQRLLWSSAARNADAFLCSMSLLCWVRCCAGNFGYGRMRSDWQSNMFLRNWEDQREEMQSLRQYLFPYHIQPRNHNSDFPQISQLWFWALQLIRELQTSEIWATQPGLHDSVHTKHI